MIFPQAEKAQEEAEKAQAPPPAPLTEEVGRLAAWLGGDGACLFFFGELCLFSCLLLLLLILFFKIEIYKYRFTCFLIVFFNCELKRCGRWWEVVFEDGRGSCITCFRCTVLQVPIGFYRVQKVCLIISFFLTILFVLPEISPKLSFTFKNH